MVDACALLAFDGGQSVRMAGCWTLMCGNLEMLGRLLNIHHLFSGFRSLVEISASKL